MADVKISGLPSDSSLDGNHYVPINDPTGPTTKRTLLSVLASWLFTQANIPSGDGSPITRDAEFIYHFAYSGLVPSADSLNSTRNGSMTSGIYYCNGKRISLAAVTARSYTASKDTYVIADDAGTLTYTEVANGGTPPTLASNQMFIAMVVTGASAITKVFQTAPRTPREIGRCKLVAGVSDNLAANFLPRKYLKYTSHMIPTGNVQAQMRLNNDSGSNYSLRYTIDNAVGAGGTSANQVGDFTSASTDVCDIFGEMNNFSAERKNGKVTSVTDTSSGAGTSPHYVEFYYKWANTSTQVNRIDVINNSTGDFNTSSELIVFGND
jgi:hypothetical protein